MSDTEERFVEGIHDLLRRRDELPWDEILSGLDGLLKRVRAEVDDATFEEARCRVAEDKLTLATLKRCAVDQCEHLLVELLQWPDDSVRRLDQVGAFARYCLEQDRPQVGLRYYAAAFDSTDWSTTVRPQEARAQCEKFLAELTHASGPASGHE